MSQKLTASIPSSVDAFTGVLEVKLDTLINEARISGHYNSPARVAGSHAGHIEAFLPFLVDPFERETI